MSKIMMKGYKDNEKITSIAESKEGVLIVIQFKNKNKSEEILKNICKEMGLQYG